MAHTVFSPCYRVLFTLFLLQIFFSKPMFATAQRSTFSHEHSDTPARDTVVQDDSNPDSCGVLFKDVQSGYSLFTALEVYNCLITVPFNQTVATQFIKYYKDTLQFQSTLAYLKNPPSTYEQPGIDLLGSLDALQTKVDSGAFNNEYDFEVSLQKLIYAAHDGHLFLSGGATEVFSFGGGDYLVSVSADGVELPKVYVESDLFLAEQSNGQWRASAIATFNGQPVTEFLTQFATVNSQGYSNPDADWNNLMYSPAQDIQFINNAFDGSSPFYPGDVYSLVFENGSTVASLDWLAVLNDLDDAIPITDKYDFYSHFVVNDYFDVGLSKRSERSEPEPLSRKSSRSSFKRKRQSAPNPQNSWNNSAYPNNPAVAEPDLGGEGVLSGYFLPESSTAVLSIPKFFAGNVTTFSNTIGDFLSAGKAAGMQKVVIDLQQNYGGTALLATDVFKQFFPKIEPFAGSRERAQPLANALGNTFTDLFNRNSSSTNYASCNVWPASTYVDAITGHNFTSWAQYFGPNFDHGDAFTTTQRDNLSSILYDEQCVGEVVYGYANRTNTSAVAAYAAEDILILTDSLCASTCTLFVEMMRHEAGVRSVVAGGRPRLGPMQLLGGTRGARVYDAYSLDIDIFVAIADNATLEGILPDRDLDFNYDIADFNLRDQIRNDSDTPLQFIQEFADCRIFYTPSTYNNFTALWQYAADAIWKTPSLCVPDDPTNSSPQGTNNTTTERSEIPAAALDSRSLDQDTGGKSAGTPCDPNVRGYCGQLICVQSPACRNNQLNPDAHQCQIPCGVGTNSCPSGLQRCFTPPFPNACLSGSCKYCPPPKVPTRASCRATRTSLHREVPDGPLNIPNGGLGRGRGRTSGR